MSQNPFTLANKTILVTGASSGIGRAIAVTCAQMGAKVIVTGRNEIALKQTLSMMEGERHTLIVADLTNNDVDFLVESIPIIDGLVSNAGINKRMLSKYLKILDMERIIKTNLSSPMLLIKSMLQLNKINTGASIVFTSSIAAFHSSIGDAVYSATKGGLTSYSKVLALELASKKIRVNTIQPGMVRTALIENSPLTDDDYAKDEKRYPLGRYGTPEEIAFAAVYLLSDATKWMTGNDLVLDGGISLI